MNHHPHLVSSKSVLLRKYFYGSITNDNNNNYSITENLSRVAVGVTDGLSRIVPDTRTSLFSLSYLFSNSLLCYQLQSLRNSYEIRKFVRKSYVIFFIRVLLRKFVALFKLASICPFSSNPIRTIEETFPPPPPLLLQISFLTRCSSLTSSVSN